MPEQNGNIILIDPMEAVSKLGNDFNGTPDYEKMFIYASLTARRRPRSVITNSGGITSTEDSFDDVTVNLMGYDYDPITKSYQTTTKWGANVDNNSTILEGFGITSIKVRTNSSYIPEVNIEFVDIRGSAFFNLGKNSPYSILFDFPPPIFELTLKGYYGNSLKYDLHIVKHSTTFNSENGFYTISAKFIARTFAPLTDLPFKYMEILPLLYTDTLPPTDPKIINGNDNINIDDLNVSPAQAPRNTHELLQKLKVAYDKLAELNDTSTEAKIVRDVSTELNDAKSVIMLLNTFKNQIQNSQFKNNSQIITVDIGGNEVSDIYTSISDVNSFRNNVNNPKSKLYLAILYEEISSIGEKKSSGTTETIVTAIKNDYNTYKQVLLTASQFIGVKSDDIGTPVPLSDNSTDITKNYLGIEITSIYKKINKFIEQKELELKTNNYVLKAKANETAYSELGLVPTIYNIFSVLCNDIDRSYNILRKTAYEAQIHHNKDVNRNVIINSVKEDKAKKSKKLTAFPLYIKEDSNGNIRRNVRSIPVDLSEKVKKISGEGFPEIDLIDNFINAFIKIRKEELNNDLRAKEDDYGNNIWIPITPMDSYTYNNQRESPYINIISSSDDANLGLLYKIYNKVLERYYVGSQYSWGRTFDREEDILNFVAESEAVNLAQSINNDNVLDLLSTKSKNYMSRPDSFYSELSGNVPLYNKLNTLGLTKNYIELRDSREGELNQPLYKKRTEEDFKGIKILNDINFPTVRTVSVSDNLSPVDKYINENATSPIIGYFKELLKINSTEVQFTTDNILFLPDKVRGEFFDTHYVTGLLGEGNGGGFVGSMGGIFSKTSGDDNGISIGKHALDLLNDMSISDNTLENNAVKTFFIASNFLHTSSCFNAEVNKYFLNPSIVEIPFFQTLYMGGLVLYGEEGTNTFKDKIDFLYDKYKNTLFAQQSTGENLTNDGKNINLLSFLDKEKFKEEFNRYISNADYNILIGNYIEMINIVESETYDADFLRGDAYITALGTTYRREITETLLTKNAIIVNNQFTFFVPNYANDEFQYDSLETGDYVPINNIVSSTSTKNNLDNYFKIFFRKLDQSLKDRRDQLKNIENDTALLLEDNDIRTSLYYSFKSISDKWISGDNNSLTKGFPLNSSGKLIDKFMFVDRAMNPIGMDTIINVEPLVDLSMDYDVNVFSVISQLLSHNGFEFFPLQNFMSHKTSDWVNAFKIDETASQNAVPAFVCMYIGGTSSYLDSPNSEYDDDGIQDLLAEGLPDFSGSDPDNQEVKDGENIDSKGVSQPYSRVHAFRVRYAEQNQSMFKSIQLDGDDFSETNDSLAILSKLSGDESTTSPVPKAQNLFNLYENRAYSARVTMLGNMMIQPTQYFQLENIPMYSGAYMILDVEHTITPNHMVTMFQGTRVLKYPNPIITDFATTVGFQAGEGMSREDAENLLSSFRRAPEYTELTQAVRDANDGNLNIGIVDSIEDLVAKNLNSWKDRNNDFILTLHPEVRDDFATLLKSWEKAGYQMIINSGYRTEEEQGGDNVKAAANNRPIASPGKSMHNYGLAIDVSWVKYNDNQNSQWRAIALIAQDLGFRWGGSRSEYPDLGTFTNSDRVHFEKTLGWGYNTETSENAIKYAYNGTVNDLRARLVAGNYYKNGDYNKNITKSENGKWTHVQNKEGIYKYVKLD